MFSNKNIFENLETYISKWSNIDTCPDITLQSTSPTSTPVSSFSSQSQSQSGGRKNELGVFPPVERIVAIGDIHGDFNALIGALYKAGVMTTLGEWNPNARNTVVIQLGDLLDGKRRTSDTDDTEDYLEEIHILQLIRHLHKEAQQYGSAFLTLMGNHELMNMLGDYRYVTDAAMKGMGGTNGRSKLFAAGGPMAKLIGCSSFGICKIGDWTFVHAGILPRHIEHKDFSFDSINRYVKDVMMGKITKEQIQKDQNSSPYRDLIYGQNAIFWTRELANINDNDDNCKIVDNAISLLNNKKNNGGIVVGHTVQDKINSKCNEKLWLIDNGMSEAFGKDNKNKIHMIEILNNTQVNII